MELAIAMNGGDDGNSYTRNSKLQREVLDDTKWLLNNCIEDHLDIQKSCKVYTIADLGCSVGPNTFSCVKTIIEAVQNKFSSQSPELTSHPDQFQVFFNDTFSNDFNTLFKALPDDRLYMAAGVPGSFYGPLFVKGSINFMHSSFTLHWLAKVPDEVLRKDSGAWNKGRVTYVRSSCEVKKAFTAQFMNDFKTFISARSKELAPGGLMVILIPCKPEISEPCGIDVMDLLGDALEDMVKEGLVDEELADSFNLPVYFPTSSEVIQVVSSDEHLDILKVEKTYMHVKSSSAEDIKNFGLHARAVMEGIISQHFGLDLPMDDLFERYCYKFKDFCVKFKNFDKTENVFLIVQRVVKGVH